MTIHYKGSPPNVAEERQLQAARAQVDAGGHHLVVVDYGRAYATKMRVDRFVVRSRVDLKNYDLYVAYDPKEES